MKGEVVEDSPYFCAPTMGIPVIAIFAKLPEPWRVKTRLIGALSAAEAAEVYAACLKDVCAEVGSIHGCEKWLVVVGGQRGAEELGERLGLDAKWRIGVQKGRGLGERMENFFWERMRMGERRVVVVGTDTPWMGRSRIARAAELLSRADVVLGPTVDGGYYLVGARKRDVPIFRGMRWGTSTVLAESVRRMRRERIPFRLLEGDFDLDRPEDLERARAMLRTAPWRSPRLAKCLE